MLQINNLSLSTDKHSILRDLCLQVNAGETVGLIGRSGSGKSLTALAILGLLPAGVRRTGSVYLGGTELTSRTERELCAIRGRDVGVVFQEPLTALNPVMPIGEQVAEVIRQHRTVSRKQARAMSDEVLCDVELPPDLVSPYRYPHELSGGQRQRVAIAIAIALRPKLLIADEPTTALDVTVQAQIVQLLDRLVRRDGLSLLFISHDVSVVAQLADHVAVLEGGALIESGPARPVLLTPRDARVRELVRAAAAPARIRQPSRPPSAAVLEVRDVSHDYALPRTAFWQRTRYRRAVDGVSFALYAAETLAIVGESGSGKSTLLRRILALEAPQRGEVLLHNHHFPHRSPAIQRSLRRHIQAVFQDPGASFNPRWRIEDIVAEPLSLLSPPPNQPERAQRVKQALLAVGLPHVDVHAFAHQFSGGERQRLALARALILAPEVIALDEATSALDGNSRQQILTLIAELARSQRTAFLLVTHDLATVRAIADRVLVLKDGCIVESGETDRVFARPQHPYTAALLSASPDLETILRRPATP